jgi:exopolysaccharide biosynthesis polyprenyl glycosylphosphotransferase
MIGAVDSAVLEHARAYDELASKAGGRTLEILTRRRRTIRRRGWLIRRALLLGDVVGLTFAAAVATLVDRPSAGWPLRPADAFAFAAFLPIWVVTAKLSGLYGRDEERTDHTTVDEVVTVLNLLSLAAWCFYLAVRLLGLSQPDLLKLGAFWAGANVAVIFARASARAIARRRLTFLQNTVIVGAGDVGQLIARKLRHHPEYGINLVGFVDADPKPRGLDVEDVPILGPPERLPAIVHAFDVERIVVAFSNEDSEKTLDLVRAVQDLETQIDIVPRLFEVVGRHTGVHAIEGVPLVSLPAIRLSPSSQLLKRALDLVVACAALLLLAPVFLVIALMIKLDSPGPVFFRQVRMGSRDETFRIFKFRTMGADADARKAEVAHLNMHLTNPDGDPRMFKIPNDPRITRIGAFLRRTSLDEIPQLLNVVRGEMSLVGARPLILDEDQYITDWARRRLDLKPGITGLWQVLGRSEIPFDEMTKLDYVYVTTWSLWRDVMLMLQTIPALLRTRRAY